MRKATELVRWLIEDQQLLCVSDAGVAQRVKATPGLVDGGLSPSGILQFAIDSHRGISIKSQFAQPPTLFNASAGSQLLFHMRGMDKAMANRFNSLVDQRGRRDWTGCMGLIREAEIDSVFIGCANEALAQNLLYIRESMANVLAWLYRERLLMDASVKTVAGLCERMQELNPLGYRMPWLYEKVVKDFLFASFSGMTGSRAWDGTEQVNGGYIVVLPTGEVLCYHASDREQFRDYLFRNTFVEYVSCKKFQWGYVEKDDQWHYVLPLNAAVRFTKVAQTRDVLEYRGN